MEFNLLLLNINILFSAKDPDKIDVICTKYKENKDIICACCSTEIPLSKLEKCQNIFDGLTRKGKEIFVKNLKILKIYENI